MISSKKVVNGQKRSHFKVKPIYNSLCSESKTIETITEYSIVTFTKAMAVNRVIGFPLIICFLYSINTMYFIDFVEKIEPICY